MTVKDYKVVCTILSEVTDRFKLDEKQEQEMLLGVRAIMTESYDKFDPGQFLNFYLEEKRDLTRFKEELTQDHLEGDQPEVSPLPIPEPKATSYLPEAESK